MKVFMKVLFNSFQLHVNGCTLGFHSCKHENHLVLENKHYTLNVWSRGRQFFFLPYKVINRGNLLLVTSVQSKLFNMHSTKSKIIWRESFVTAGLSFSFYSPVALIFTPVANLLLCAG